MLHLPVFAGTFDRIILFCHMLIVSYSISPLSYASFACFAKLLFIIIKLYLYTLFWHLMSSSLSVFPYLAFRFFLTNVSTTIGVCEVVKIPLLCLSVLTLRFQAAACAHNDTLCSNVPALGRHADLCPASGKEF